VIKAGASLGAMALRMVSLATTTAARQKGVPALAADGKQLIVTVKADSRMVRNVQNGDIRRVYDRQQQ